MRIGVNLLNFGPGDRWSDGRFILGVGVGWARQEFKAPAWTSDPASHAGPFGLPRLRRIAAAEGRPLPAR